jgi:hypothetical protein
MVDLLFPDIVVLEEFIQNAFRERGHKVDSLKITRRIPMEAGINMSEVIHCVLNSVDEAGYFCKYETLGNSQRKSLGHRVGVEYESRIYADVLYRVQGAAPPYIGSGILGDTGKIVLVLGYMAGYRSVLPESEHEMEAAAAAAGRLQRSMVSDVPSFVRRYTKEFFLYWMNAFRSLIQDEGVDDSWLYKQCDYFEGNVDLLLQEPMTLVHGEFYAKNILINNNQVFMIDWESAGYGIGELDLAALLDSKGNKEISIRSYIESRWPDATIDKDAFQQRLILSRMYFYFRWLSTKKYKGIRSFLRTKWVDTSMRSLGSEAGLY